MSVFKLKITGCTDSLMWYASHVGEYFPLRRIVAEGFISQEPSGYSNVVRFNDAIVLDENNKEISLKKLCRDLRMTKISV